MLELANPPRFAPEKVLPRVRTLAESIAQAEGAQALSVEFVMEAGHRYLRILVQEAGGTRLATCEKISRLLSRQLDAQDFIPVAYFLEVSSPGLPADTVPQGEEESL